MPSMITHWLFAEKVEEKLGFGCSVSEKKMRLWGAQGPDILFCHRTMPLKKKGESLSEYGHRMHTMPDPAPLIAALQQCEEEELGGTLGRAWRQGFLCHYLLDRTCHPFVTARARWLHEQLPVQPVSYCHQEIEASLDTMMLRRETGQLPQERAVHGALPPLDDSEKEILALHLERLIFAGFQIHVEKKRLYQVMSDASYAYHLATDKTGLKRMLTRRWERKKSWRISSRLLPMTEDPQWDHANLDHAVWGEKGEEDDFFALYDRAVEESPAFFALYQTNCAEQVTAHIPFC